LYTAPYDYIKTFWKKDGKIIYLQIPNRRKKRDVTDANPDALPNLPRFSVPDYKIKELTLADQGFYECGVIGDKGEYSSEKTYLQLTGLLCKHFYLVCLDT